MLDNTRSMGLACRISEDFQGLTFLTPEVEAVVHSAQGGTDFLSEACEAARRAFGDALVGASVSFFYDPEDSSGSPYLDLELRTRGARAEVRRMLKAFDHDWWLDACDRAPFSIPMQVTQGRA